MKQLKLLSTVILAGLLTVNTLAIDLNINNTTIACSQEPIIQNGTTLVPLRVISENLGAEVKWDKSTKTVTVIKEDKTIVLTIGSKTATVNGEFIMLAQAPKVINNTTMLPIRFVSEQLACNVLWNSPTQTVYVTEEGVEPQLPDTSNWKTTTIKNPKLFNGKVYLSGAQMKQALNVNCFANQNGFIQATRDDFDGWFSKVDKYGNGAVNSINGGNFDIYKSRKDARLQLANGTYYYPVEFLAKWLNCTVSYNKSNNSATIIFKGPKYWEITNAKINTVTGYVKTQDGKPVPGIIVRVEPMTIKGTDYRAMEEENLAQGVITDSNGKYSIDINTEKIKYVYISVQESDQANPVYKAYHAQSEGVVTKLQPKLVYTNEMFPTVLTPSNLTNYPDLIAYKQK